MKRTSPLFDQKSAFSKMVLALRRDSGVLLQKNTVVSLALSDSFFGNMEFSLPEAFTDYEITNYIQ